MVVDLEVAYRNGAMGGGSYRQCSQACISPDKVVGKLSKVGDETKLLLVFCSEAKRDGVAKKVAKYNEKGGERITIAWATAKHDAYPVQTQ